MAVGLIPAAEPADTEMVSRFRDGQNALGF
jgi:hypothetical protein